MGIEAFLGVIATGGFLIGLAGIAFIVVNASRGQGVRNGIVMAVAGFVLGLVFLVISEGLVTVQPTQRVVVFNVLTGNLEDPLEPGIHIVIPGIEQTTPYRVSRQEYTMSGISGEGNRSTDDAIEARSIDGQEVSIDVTIIFTLDPENVNRVHENWSDSEQGFLEGLIRPTIRSITRDVVATARAEEIFGSAQLAEAAVDDNGDAVDTSTDADAPQAGIPVDAEGNILPNPSPESRAEVQAEIERLVTVELAREGFTTIQVLLREINFSEDFIQAIENRQVAELERDRAEVQAETTRIEAGGRADARIEEARGEAEAIRIQAQAEAEALSLVSAQIAANPNLIQYTYVTNLSDNISVALLPSNSPFLFDANTFTDLGDDFETPAVPQSSSSSTSPVVVPTNTPDTSNDSNSGD